MSNTQPIDPSSPGGLFVRATSDTAELATVRRQVEAFAAEHGFDERAVGELGLCVNEAMANIIRHAYRGRGGEPIELTATFADEKLKIALRDWGEGQPPESLPTAKDDPMKPGGLGLICMGRLMDKVTFTPQAKGMLLELIRKRSGRSV